MKEATTAGKQMRNLKAYGNGFSAGYQTGHNEGYQQGYKQAVKDMAKKIKELETYGGNKPEKRADGVPEHHAGRTANLQHELQRAGAEKRDGRSLGAVPEESENP